MNTNDREALLRARVPGVRLQRARDVQPPFRVRRPFGLLSMDVGSGGGAPAGGITELWGEDNAGKNLTINMAMRQNQRIHGADSKMAVLCVENMFDKTFARHCGVYVALSPEEISGLEELAGYTFSENERASLQEEVGVIEVLEAPDAESALEALCALIETDEYQIIVVDSIAQMIPSDEWSKPFMEQGMLGAKLPQLLARFSRKIPPSYYAQPHGRPNLTSVIMTNQITAKIGGFVQPGMPAPVQQKGGYAMRHTKWLSIKLRSGKATKQGSVEIENEMHWEVTKGKAGCADGAFGTYMFRKNGAVFGPDYKSDALAVALGCGLFVQRGSAFDSLPHNITVVGKANFLDALDAAEPDWFFNLYYPVMRAKNIHAYTTWVEQHERPDTAVEPEAGSEVVEKPRGKQRKKTRR